MNNQSNRPGIHKRRINKNEKQYEKTVEKLKTPLEIT